METKITRFRKALIKFKASEGFANDYLELFQTVVSVTKPADGLLWSDLDTVLTDENSKSTLSEHTGNLKLSSSLEMSMKTKKFHWEVLRGMGRLLDYKNTKYGDSANTPLKIFSKADATEGIEQRLDDKIARIKNSDELRKNDVSDLIGYLVLLCVSKKWFDFGEFMD